MTDEAVEAVISQLNPPHPVWVANLNCPGQVVIAGSLDALAIAADALKQKGAKRVLALRGVRCVSQRPDGICAREFKR